MQADSHNADDKCQKMQEALSASFDGEADSALQALAQAHLKECATCATMWAGWQQLRQLESRAVAEVKVPKHLPQAIMAQTTRQSIPLWQRLWPKVAAATAIPAVALGAWLLMIMPQQNVVTPPVQTNTTQNRIASLSDQESSSNSTEETTNPVSRKVTPNEHAAKVSDELPKVAYSHSVAPRKSTFTSHKSTFSGHKSTFVPAKKTTPKPAVAHTPQISLASLKTPTLRMSPKAPLQLSAGVKPAILATNPLKVAASPTRLADADFAEDADSDTPPDALTEYVSQSDVRPPAIRAAMLDYREVMLEEVTDNSAQSSS